MIFKKTLCVTMSLVIIISTISLGAVVSDNDGSAFITKAEFDSLKNNFQSQLDTYNTGIDSKIDSAIAGYLAGIKVEKERIYTPICYTAEGILAPRGNYQDLKWVEGTMNLKFTIYYCNGSTNSDSSFGTYRMDWDGKTPTNFTELSVTNVNYSNGTAKWNGQIKSKQYYYGLSYDTQFNVAGGNLSDVDYKYASIYNGFFSVSNKSFFSDGSSMLHLQYTYATDSISFGVFGKCNQSRFNRDISETKYKSIICVPQTVSCTRFSNIDEIRDWCNDTTTTDHTMLTKLDSLFNGSTSSSTMYVVPNSGVRQGKTRTWTMDFSSNTIQGGSITNLRRCKPYFGFVSTINSYSKLWTDIYDRYMDQFIESDSTMNVFTDDDGKKHLWLYSGAPALKVQKDTTLVIDMEFEDKTKNYDVWLRYGAFRNLSPTSETNLVPVDKVYYDEGKHTSASSGSASKSILVSGGKKTLVVEIEQDGYIFLKWSLYGNSAAGGGLFKTPKEIKLISNN